MRIQYQFCEVALAAFLSSCFAAGATAQQSSQQQDLPILSPTVHAALYPEVMCVHCIVPQWDSGHILHLEIDKDPAVVTMYDRNGKKVLESRLEPPDFARVSILAAGATQAGGILAVGGGAMTDGSVQGFIAKTDLAGRTVQSVHTGRFSPRQVCEATDGTVWTLGYDLDFRDSPDADKNVLRHYSFEKGLLASLVSLDSISKSPDATLYISSPKKRSFLRCGKDRVSVLFWSAAQYIEVDASDGKPLCWKVALPPMVGGEANGFAVTNKERMFVSLQGFSEPDNTVTHGLYELKAKTGTSVATLIPVDGTLTTHDRNGIPPDDTLDQLWGADGDELVVHRHGDGWGISWAKVSASPSSPESPTATSDSASNSSSANSEKIYRAGKDGVSSPSCFYMPGPLSTKEAQAAKFEGVVIADVVVTPYGRLENIRIVKSPGLGLDDSVRETLGKWRCQPAKLDGKAVPVKLEFEFNFLAP